MPDPLLTLPEICELYQVSDRRARDIVRLHAVPVLCPGRHWLFDARAEAAFREATRLCPSSSPAAKAPRSGGSRARSAASEYEKALALIESGLPAKPSPSGKQKPTVLHFTGRSRPSAA